MIWWKLAWKFIRRFWLPIVIASIFIGVAVHYNGLVRKNERLTDEKADLIEDNATLKTQLVIFEDTGEKIDATNAKVDRYTKTLDLFVKASTAYQGRMEAREQKPPQVIRVPVEVAAPGTPCEVADVELAEWLAEEVTP